MDILITGVTSGIGKALTHTFIENGHRVIGIARTTKVLEELKTKYVDSFEYITFDLTETFRLDELISKIDNISNNIGLLINNAGLGNYGDFYEGSFIDDNRLLNLNITAPLYLLKHYLKEMISKNQGTIIDVASTSVFQSGGPLMSTYYASKSFIYILDEGIRYELKVKNSNVKLLTLCPGPTSTNFKGMKEELTHLERLYITSPETVARECYRGFLNKKSIIIPGFLNKIFRILSCFIPNPIKNKIVYNIQIKKRVD